MCPSLCCLTAAPLPTSPGRPPTGAWLGGGGPGSGDGWLWMMGCCDGLRALNAEGLCVRWLKSRGPASPPGEAPPSMAQRGQVMDGCQDRPHLCRTRLSATNGHGGQGAGNPSLNLWCGAGPCPEPWTTMPSSPSPWGGGGVEAVGKGRPQPPPEWGRGEPPQPPCVLPMGTQLSLGCLAMDGAVTTLPHLCPAGIGYVT